MAEKRKQNGHAKPEDFLLPELSEFEEAVLPSGLKVKLRRPISLEFWAHVGDLPGSLAAASRGEQIERPSAEEIIRWSYQMICALVVEPVFSSEPQAGEFHPRRLQPADRAWLTAYYNHYTRGGGAAALESFRGPAAKSAGAGSGGKKVRESSE